MKKRTELRLGDIIVCRGCKEKVVVGGKSHICPKFMARMDAEAAKMGLQPLVRS